MPRVDYSNVNISIQQFQEISSGKYNAGEVKLASATTLDKINNSVGWFARNKTEISQAEVLAIKNAFVRALSQSGLGADEINNVRRTLGLAPNGATDADFAARSIRPLSRQQVREILDSHAATINARVGAGTIRSHAEIYAARYSEQERAGFALTRNAVNEAMMRSRHTLPDRALSDIQAILAGDVRFSSPEERRRLITAAGRQRAAILQHSNGNPSEAPNGTLKLHRASDGLTVTFALGMSEKDYVRKLDDILLFLHIHENPVDRNAPIPALTSAESNINVLAVLTGQSHGLPTKETEAIMAAVRNKTAERFGADLFKANAQFRLFASYGAVTRAMDSLGDMAGRRFTVDEIVDAIVREATTEVARAFMSKTLAQKLQATGGDAGSSATLTSNLNARHPQLLQRLCAATTLAEARATMNSFLPEIESGIRRQCAMNRSFSAVCDWYRQEIAEAMGVPVDSLDDAALVSVQRLRSKADALNAEIGSGRNAANTDEEIERAYRNLAHEMAGERIALLGQVNSMKDLPPSARDTLKGLILSFNKVTGLDLNALRPESENAEVVEKVNALAEALIGEADDDTVIAKMAEVGQNVGLVATAAIGGQEGMVGEGDTAFKLLLVLALTKRPEIFNLMPGFFQRPGIADLNFAEMEGPALNAAAFNIFRQDRPIAETNAALADSLGKAEMKPLVAEAFNGAFADLGMADSPAAEKKCLLQGAHMRKLVQTVRNSAEPITPTKLRGLAWTAFVEDAAHHNFRKVLSRLAEANGWHGISADSLDIVKGVVLRRNPGLLAKITAAVTSAAVNGESVVDALDKLLAAHYETATVALQAVHKIEEASAGAFDKACREISVRANLPEEFVRKHLDASGLLVDQGGSLSFLRADVKEALIKPDLDIAAYDLDALAGEAADKVERFISRKVDFVAKVDQLNLSEAAKGAMIARTLEQASYKDGAHVEIAARVAASEEVRNAIDLMKRSFTEEMVANLHDADLFRIIEVYSRSVDMVMEREIGDEQRAGMDVGDIEVIRQLVAFTMLDICGDTLKKASELLARDGRFDTILAAGRAVADGYNAQYLDAAEAQYLNAEPAQQPGQAQQPVNEAVAEAEARAAAAERSLASARAANNVIGIITAALYDDWLPADLAEAYRREEIGVAERCHATVKYAPSACAAASAGLDEPARARLKAFAITLDWSDGVRANTEFVLKDAARILRDEKDAGKADERLAELADSLFKREDAGAFIAAAVRAQEGLQLDAAQVRKAVQLLADFGAGMPAKNARILARFITNLQLTVQTAEIDRRRVEFISKSIAQWRDLDFSDSGKEDFESFCKDEFNAVLMHYEKPENNADEFNDDIFNAFAFDVPRGNYTISGVRQLLGGNVAPVLAELQKLNLSPAAKRALTMLMSQTSGAFLMKFQVNSPLPPHDLRQQELDPSTIPGGGAIVSRKNDFELFFSPQVVGNIQSVYDLNVSEDGKTATLKVVKTQTLNVGSDESRMFSSFGSVVVEQELTVDIASEVPSVTKVRVAQRVSDELDLHEKYMLETAPIPKPPEVPKAPVSK